MNNNNNSQFASLHHRLAYIDASLRHACSSLTDVQNSLDDDRQADGALAAELFNLESILNQLEQHMSKLSPDAPDDQPATGAEEGAPAGNAAAAERNLLLRALDAQEARIRELETELRSLRGPAGDVVPPQESVEDAALAEILSKDPQPADSATGRMIVAIQDGGNLKVGLAPGITTIGREPANDLQIRSRFVSRFHARIVNDSGAAVIEDLDSRNGITVNADKVRRRELRSGDYIRIGRVQLQFIDIMEGSVGGDA